MCGWTLVSSQRSRFGPISNSKWLSRHPPQPYRAILTARNGKLPVRRERHAVHLARMSEKAPGATVGQVPQAQRGVSAAGEGVEPVGREGHAVHRTLVSLEDAQLAAAADIP